MWKLPCCDTAIAQTNPTIGQATEAYLSGLLEGALSDALGTPALPVCERLWQLLATRPPLLPLTRDETACRTTANHCPGPLQILSLVSVASDLTGLPIVCMSLPFAPVLLHGTDPSYGEL